MLDRNISSISFIFCALCVSFRFALVFPFFFCIFHSLFLYNSLNYARKCCGRYVVKNYAAKYQQQKTATPPTDKETKNEMHSNGIVAAFQFANIVKVAQGKNWISIKEFFRFSKGNRNLKGNRSLTDYSLSKKGKFDTSIYNNNRLIRIDQLIPATFPFLKLLYLLAIMRLP